MGTTIIFHITLDYLAILVAFSFLFTPVQSMETPNGYLCNLCYSRENEYHYPPPSIEQKVVRFTSPISSTAAKSEQQERESTTVTSINVAFGMPWDIGTTCIDVWNKVLDYKNPNIVDESSCRSMAALFAPQCCNQHEHEREREEVSVKEASFTGLEENKTQTELRESIGSDSHNLQRRGRRAAATSYNLRGYSLTGYEIKRR